MAIKNNDKKWKHAFKALSQVFGVQMVKRLFIREKQQQTLKQTQRVVCTQNEREEESLSQKCKLRIFIANMRPHTNIDNIIKGKFQQQLQQWTNTTRSWTSESFAHPLFVLAFIAFHASPVNVTSNFTSFYCTCRPQSQSWSSSSILLGYYALNSRTSQGANQYSQCWRPGAYNMLHWFLNSPSAVGDTWPQFDVRFLSNEARQHKNLLWSGLRGWRPLI